MPTISPSPRVRPSPYFDETVEDGVAAFTSYNHMLMPVSYGDPEAEYDRLINGVSMWDVSVERQVELQGPDAGRLAQRLCARDLSNMPVNMGWYVAICDERGTLINDPILLKLAEDRYWLSIADSDVKLWARAVAAAERMNVGVSEPDVSPLAIQGPKSDDVCAALFGDWVRDLKYFEVREAVLDDIPLMVARSGWSKQGGFELYLMDGALGPALWRRVKEAGQPWGIGPGSPNQSERVESGLLSYGTDTDDETNPYEVRMGRFVDLDADFIGAEALRRIKAEGAKRKQVGLLLDDGEARPGIVKWAGARNGNRTVGHMTTNAWSPRLGRNIGIGLVARDVEVGEKLQITIGGEIVEAEVCKLPFL
ncbi:MAG: glycine cleavage T C-terminal barrel domain-containing protein [Pseudomonadota bacterium]